MKQQELKYTTSKEKEPHRGRTKQILKKHPEVKQYMTKNPWSIFIILFFVSVQIGLAIFVASQPWWVMLLVAYSVGAFANHALWVMIHECSHNLLFRKKVLNTLSGMIANLPHIVPSSASFAKYHMKHHAFQGVYELDADLAEEWEGRLVKNIWYRKAIWLLLFPVFQIFRTSRMKEIQLFDKWVFLNLAIQVSFNAAIWYFFGFQALIYLLVSLFFSIGLHPLGARWIQEHYLVAAPQETYSYYGPLNTIAFNVGFHNEHHDFPSVPWNKLPEVKATAPEFYDNLVSHRSWTRLLFQFIFDPRLSLFSRMTRKERGGIALDAPVKPDLELVIQP